MAETENTPVENMVEGVRKSIIQRFTINSFPNSILVAKQTKNMSKTVVLSSEHYAYFKWAEP